MAVCEVFPMFQQLTSSISLGCAGSLVALKLMTSCPTVCCVYLCLAGHGMECDPSG
jgi:hypothetical protein